jgi:glycosyltransferase involved in cell wall biosynthesis
MSDAVYIVEIVRGLGLGGAEQSLLSRLKGKPKSFKTILLNTKPSIDDSMLRQRITEYSDIRDFSGALAYFRLCTQVHKLEPEILVVRTPLDFIFFAALRTIQISRPKWKLVFEIHSTRISPNLLRSTLLKPLLHLFAYQAQLAICVSDEVKNGEQGRLFPKSVTLLLGCSIEASIDNLEDGIQYPLIFVGRMVRSKRPDWLVEQIGKIRGRVKLPIPTLIMVGDGPLTNEVKRLVNKKSLEKEVLVVGKSNSVDEWLRKCQMLVISSSYEGLPIAFMEARILGLRVLSTPVIRDPNLLGEYDLVAESFDGLEFQDLLIRALKFPILSDNERQIRAKKFEFFGYQAFAQRYYKLISET